HPRVVLVGESQKASDGGEEENAAQGSAAACALDGSKELRPRDNRHDGHPGRDQRQGDQPLAELGIESRGIDDRRDEYEGERAYHEPGREAAESAERSGDLGDPRAFLGCPAEERLSARVTESRCRTGLRPTPRAPAP